MSQILLTVRMLIGMLIGSKWVAAGETADIEESRAKLLQERGRCEILGPSGTVAPPSRSTLADDGEDGHEDDSGGDEDGAGPVMGATPLSEAGISGKTAKLLTEAGFDTVEMLREATEEQLLAVDGLGPKSVQSVLAAIRTE